MTKTANFLIFLVATASRAHAQVESTVTCGTVDTNWVIETCLNSFQRIAFYGNCTGGVKEEEWFVEECPFFAEICHVCGPNQVVCSSSADQATSCSSIEDGIPSEVDCAQLGFALTNQCTSDTDFEINELQCSDFLEDSITTANSSCSGFDAALPTCVDCGAASYCVPNGTTCSDLDTPGEPVAIASEVTCTAVDSNFYVEKCLDNFTFGSFFGNCTEGEKTEDVSVTVCPVESPFCHECGFYKIVCSDSPVQDTACGAFPGDVPTEVDCSQAYSELVSGNQCANDTHFIYEVGGCTFQDTVYEACADFFSSLTACLDCGQVSYCVPENTTCVDLGVTQPPVIEPPITEPPVVQPPITEPPATESPVTEPPATEPPVTGPPATEPTITEPPATEPPVTGPPSGTTDKRVVGFSILLSLAMATAIFNICSWLIV